MPVEAVATELGWWGVPIGILGGALRVSTPILYVSLGETLTEKSGRINLGLEGTLIMGAMAGYGVSSMSGSPWAGVLVAGIAGCAMGWLHAVICARPRVNDIALGIAMMIFGVGLASFLGKPFIQTKEPVRGMPDVDFGFWSSTPSLHNALQVNYLFILGAILAPCLYWALKNTRWGLILRSVGENADTARAMGYSVNRVRMLATMAGGFLAGVGGSFLTLRYPGSWNDGLSTGQGLMAVALVIFARWNPVNCLFAALLFGGASAIGPSMQSVGVTKGRYLFDAIPYVVTLGIMIMTSSGSKQMVGIPAELTRAR
jgi:simple sugar transport system permease protein